MEEKAKQMIKRHEGYRPNIYFDSRGFPTGGYGHAFLPGSKLSKTIWEMIFEYDFVRTVYDLSVFININKLNHLSENRQIVLLDMIYNIGMSKLMNFKKMIKAMQREDYEEAARQMRDSAWYSQVKSRAIELIEIMRTDKI